MVEENKSMDFALKVAKTMKEFNIDRRTEPVLAIGGGVCLDVVGFAASIFRRRTPYIRVPTTALSYVDASEGADVPARVLQLAIETMLEELAPNLWEHSLDRLVDFGHAVGQDLEMAALGTENELMHGESVACDMALMTVLAQELGLLTEAERDRTLNMLRGCQVPIWSPVMTYELFAEAVANRVKNSMGQRFPLPVGIGKGQVVNDVSEKDLRSAWLLWQELCATPGVETDDSVMG